MTKMSITSIGPRQLKQKKHFVDIKNRFWYLHWKIILIYQVLRNLIIEYYLFEFISATITLNYVTLNIS